jgi:hypothetical protein
MKTLIRSALLLGLSTLSAMPAYAARLPKFGPYAIPINQQQDYVRNYPAVDYWKFSEFYLAQQTSSACSLATTAMAVNFLRGIPPYADQTLVSQNELLTNAFSGIWANRVAEGGDGVTFDEWVYLVKKSLAAYRLRHYTVQVIRATDHSLDDIKAILAANEASDGDLLLAYFNQGVLTGDWDGPHISPIGAYNQATGQVLIMDVDRDWYVPYWSPDFKLQEALLRPAPADQGILAGQIGGLLWIRPDDN